MTRVMITMAMALTLVFFQGCKQEDDETSGNGSTLNYSIIHSGSQRVDTDVGSSKKSYVITTQEEYESLLSSYSADTPNEIDFDEEQILVIDMGERSDSSYSIRIDEAKEYSDASIIDITFQHKEGCDTTTTVISYPFLFVQLATDKDILINEEKTVISCDSNAT